jgi:hypothetical protein
MLLNMITVLVIDGYLESKKLDNIKFSEAEIDELYRMWAQYDPDKTGLMKCDNFILFLHQLYAPFGILDKDNPKHIKPSHIVNKFIYREDLKVIVYSKRVTGNGQAVSQSTFTRQEESTLYTSLITLLI